MSGATQILRDPHESLARRSQTTLVDEIVEAIRDRILRGELAPGLKINQQAFAEDLGVSRTPLREAFQRLEADGWVSLRARRGAEVRALSVQEAEEIFAMRVVLETAAARVTATTHTDADAARVQALLQASPRDNEAFHDLIYGLGRAPLPTELESAVRRYFARALRYRLVYWSHPSSVARSLEAHVAIHDAWSRRDPDATEHAVAAHILAALGEIAVRIEPAYTPSAIVQALAERHRVALAPSPPPEDR